MLQIAFLLHFYQPSTQLPEVLKEIVKQSYKPLLSLFQEFPQAHLSVNLAGSLLDLLNSSGEPGLISGWKEIVGRGSLELVGSAKYHPLLPKLPRSEIKRQIVLQEESLRQILGVRGKLRGFFPPEMAYSREVAEEVCEMGYQWLISDESADVGEVQSSPRELVKQTRGLPLKIFFRQPFLSESIAFAKIRTLAEFKVSIAPFFNSSGYLVLAMDGETFGWHRPGQMAFLRELFEAQVSGSLGVKLVTISELYDYYPTGEEIDPQLSTWGAVKKDQLTGRVFPRWDNPDNPLHKLQWELFNLAVSVGSVEPDGSKSRQSLDKAVQSDQFWWASGNPCWHPVMVQGGAALLKQVVFASSMATSENKERANFLTQEIEKTGRVMFGNKPIAC